MPHHESAPPLPSATPEARLRANRRASKMAMPGQTPMLKSPPKGKNATAGRTAAWTPPPLFQAYGQAIKHATLDASTLSAEAILRGETSGKNKLDLTIEEENDEFDGPPRIRHKRTASSPGVASGWTQKIYMLMPTGYVLQYAGEGQFDRLPEKLLQLDEHSVAFATDVLPGKHWVLQISHLEEGQQTVDLGGPRSRFSRLSFRSASSRRMVSNMLLVMRSPEDMDAWMSLIRKEIEVVGGKAHDLGLTSKKSGETDTSSSNSEPHSIMQRYSMMPNSGRHGHGRPSDLAFRPSSRDHASSRDHFSALASSPIAASSESMYSASSPQRPSVGAASLGTPSIATTAMSEDQAQLEKLRDDARLSFMSFGTLNTSRASSPTSSRADKEDILMPQGLSPKRRTSVKITPARRSASAMAHRRDSQLLSGDVISQSKMLRPRSTYGQPQSGTVLRAGNSRSNSAQRESTTLGSLEAIPIRSASPTTDKEASASEQTSSSRSKSKRHRHSTSTGVVPTKDMSTPAATDSSPAEEDGGSPLLAASDFAFPRVPDAVGNHSLSSRTTETKDFAKAASPAAQDESVEASKSSSTSFFHNLDSSPETSAAVSPMLLQQGHKHISKSTPSSATTPMTEEPPVNSSEKGRKVPAPAEQLVDDSSDDEYEHIYDGASRPGTSLAERRMSQSSSSAGSTHHPPRTSSYFTTPRTLANKSLKTKAKPRSARVRNRRSLTSLLPNNPMGPPSAPPPTMPLPTVPGVGKVGASSPPSKAAAFKALGSARRGQKGQRFPVSPTIPSS